MQEASAVPTLNVLTSGSARQPWILTERHTNNIVEKHRVLPLPATKFFSALLLPARPVSFVEDTLTEVEVVEHKVKETSAIGASSSSSIDLVPSVSQSTSSTAHLSTIRNFMKSMGVDVQFAEMEGKTRKDLRDIIETERYK